jgi:carbon monoxide dehydrogenase subunit G
MELEHSFSVPVPVERAWDVLLDVERVAPCMPGASLDSVDGDKIAGKIKVKVGPIQMTYAGTAKFTERDKAAGVVVLEASGKETRGAGTASATVRSELTGDGDQTQVTVHTSLNVTGKPAQFGRGVLEEVGGKLVGIFAGNLAGMLAAEPASAGGDVPPGQDVPAEQEDPAEEQEPEAQENVAAPDAAADEALPIDVLSLSTRAWSSLRQDGIQTVGDLIRRTEQQLLTIDNIGPASLSDIKNKLADRGLTLAAADGSAAPSAGPGPAGSLPAAPEAASSGGPALGLNGDRPSGKHAGPDEDLADVTPLRPARHEAKRPAEPAWQPHDTEAIDLLGVAGLPVLKRALPAAAGLIAVILVLLGLRRRRAGRH